FGFFGEEGVTSPQRPGGPPEQVPGSLNKFWNNVLPFRNQNSSAQKPQYPPTTPTNMGLTQIHPSRVLEMPANELPDWRLAPPGGGWGDSVLQTVVDAITGFTQMQQSMAAMVNDGKLDIIKIPLMTEMLANEDQKNRMVQRFALSAQTKSTISAL